MSEETEDHRKSKTHKVYNRMVELGRVCMIASGKYKGKLCVIVDVLSEKRVLIDGPESGVPRTTENLRNLHLTDLVVKRTAKKKDSDDTKIQSITHGESTKCLRRHWIQSDIQKQWESTVWAKKMQQKKMRAEMTDFDRFKVSVAKKRLNYELQKKL